jgi:DNA mismatch endonuclease, patch repair protein
MARDLPYPYPSSAVVTAVMKANPRSDTKPELQLRSFLHRLGYRFRKDLSIQAAGRRVRPDIAFTRQRLAIFIDGCFWHCCPEHGHVPRANSGYWPEKLRRNVERDRLATEHLMTAGWTVIRLWEHVPIEEAAREVLAALKGADPPDLGFKDFS